jgi:UDP-2,4-diacetamido-2,4,6-trideoxy-beta-L-altropyranose hydrolase
LRKIIIRADGCYNIGFGHVYRMISFCHMLRRNFDIEFISHNSLDFLSKELEKLNIPLLSVSEINYSLPDAKNSRDEVPYDMDEYIKGDEIVILDGYWFGENFQKSIKSKGAKLVMIDDLQSGKIYADLVINSLPSANSNQFDAQLYTKFALGYKYVFLRPAFLRAAKNSIEKIQIGLNIRSVLICFGGSDSKGLTISTLKEVVKFNQFEKIYVVIGHSFIHNNELEKIVDSRIRILISIDDEQFVDVLNKIDLVIVPASGVMIEAVSMGKIVIAGMYANNQEKQLKDYIELGAVISAGSFTVEETSSAVKSSFEIKKMPPKIIDGLSGDRLYSLIQNL